MAGAAVDLPARLSLPAGDGSPSAILHADDRDAELEAFVRDLKVVAAVLRGAG